MICDIVIDRDYAVLIFLHLIDIIRSGSGQISLRLVQSIRQSLKTKGITERINLVLNISLDFTLKT